jgi:hypothetical protein
VADDGGVSGNDVAAMVFAGAVKMNCPRICTNIHEWIFTAEVAEERGVCFATDGAQMDTDGRILVAASFRFLFRATMV